MRKFCLKTLSEEEIYEITSSFKSTGYFGSITYIHQEFALDSHTITIVCKASNTKFGCYSGMKSVKEKRAEMAERGETPARESSYVYVEGDPKAIRRDKSTQTKKYVQTCIFRNTRFVEEILVDGKKPLKLSDSLIAAINEQKEPLSKKKDMFILPLYKIVDLK